MGKNNSKHDHGSAEMYLDTGSGHVERIRAQTGLRVFAAAIVAIGVLDHTFSSVVGMSKMRYNFLTTFPTQALQKVFVTQ